MKIKPFVRRVLMWKKVLKIIFILLCVTQIQATAKFSNIVCTSFDPNFAMFEYCYIKSINRTYQYISLRTKLLKVPVDNATLSFELTKRANGYKPFLYNFTADACKFLKHRKNPLYNFFYIVLAEFSNINHTCPYSHDIIVEKLSTQRLNVLFTDLLPMPRGDFGVHATWFAYNIRRAIISTFITLS